MSISIDELQETIVKMQRRIDELTTENKQLHAKLNEKVDPVLMYGNEKDLYPGEIKDIILSTLETSIPNQNQHTRRVDVIKDIILCNHYDSIGKMRINKVRSILKSYKQMDRKTKNALEDLGFVLNITGHNKHIIASYYGDKRYKVTFATSPSDSRTCKNIASDVIHTCM